MSALLSPVPQRGSKRPRIAEDSNGSDVDDTSLAAACTSPSAAPDLNSPPKRRKDMSPHALPTFDTAIACERKLPGIQPSHLRRPVGAVSLAVETGESRVHPVSISVGGSNAESTSNGSATDPDREGIDGEEIPFPEMVHVLSPLLASSLGIAPSSMRSFLRLDDLSLDLLSPLGASRPGSAAAGFLHA